MKPASYGAASLDVDLQTFTAKIRHQFLDLVD